MTTEDRPPGWLTSATLRVALVVVGAGVVVWAVDRLRTLVFIVFVALFLSIALEPAVHYLSHRGWRRQTATVVVFFLAFLAASAFVASLVPVFVSQASALVRNMPGYIEDVQGWLDAQPNLNIEILNQGVEDEFQSLGNILSSYGTRVAGGVFALGNTLFSVIFRFVTILLFAFYMVSDGPKMRRTFLSFLPPHRQREALRMWEIAVEKTGGYIYSRLLLTVVAASFTALVLSVLDVPYSIALGLWVGVLSQFVPVIGTYIAAILPVLVALVPSGPADGWHLGRSLWVLGALVGYQQVENLLVAPKITAKAMAIHPAVSVASVIAGASLLGGIGAVLALPVTATIQAVLSEALARHDLIESDALTEQEPKVKRRG